MPTRKRDRGVALGQTLTDLCEFIIDCEHKTAPTQDEGYPSIRTPNIGRGRLLLDGVNRVSEETYQRWTRRAAPQAGDLILAREAPVGNVAVVPPGLKVCLGQRTVLIRPDRIKVDPNYLAYRLLGSDIQGHIRGLSTGATVDHLNVADIRALPIRSLPGIADQRRIAGTISTYDDLIENNTKRIKILEDMGVALYREWFANFRFPGHEKTKFINSTLGRVPSTWTLTKLGERVEFAYGKALKEEDRQPGEVPVYGSSGVVGLHNESYSEGPGIIVGRKGNVGSVHWCDVPFFPIDTVFFVRTSLPLHFVFFNLQGQRFINNDAAVPGLSRNQAYSLPLLVPDAEVLAKFVDFAKMLFHQIRLLSKTAENLRATRDLLLPRLISGEIDVSSLRLESAAS